MAGVEPALIEGVAQVIVRIDVAPRPRLGIAVEDVRQRKLSARMMGLPFDQLLETDRNSGRERPRAGRPGRGCPIPPPYSPRRSRYRRPPAPGRRSGSPSRSGLPSGPGASCPSMRSSRPDGRTKVRDAIIPVAPGDGDRGPERGRGGAQFRIVRRDLSRAGRPVRGPGGGLRHGAGASCAGER